VYKITYTNRAIKALQKAPREVAALIRQKMTIVAKDPYADIPNAKKLEGRSGYRLRVGDWRVIYEINSAEITIIVVKIGIRGEVYK
jgi:mRNA interferase RelE/StbE